MINIMIILIKGRCIIIGYLCIYERTVFYNPQNRYCIISVKTSDKNVPEQARSKYS